MARVDHLARAEALLTATPLVDGHNDLPWALRVTGGTDSSAADLAGGLPALHTDLPRLRAGRVGVQFWSVYVPCSLAGADAVTAVLGRSTSCTGSPNATPPTSRSPTRPLPP